MPNDLQPLVDAASAAAPDDELYLTTVVRVRGSAYRQPGARMLSTRSKRLAGSISGGCLEADVVRRAPFRTRDHRAVIATYDASADDDVETGFGQGCGGAIELLIERLDRSPGSSPLEFFAGVLHDEKVGVMLTVIRSADEAVPVGARLAVVDGKEWTSVASEAARSELRRIAKKANERSRADERDRVVACASSESFEAFVEVVRPPVHLYVFGTGFDVVPVVHFAKLIGWQVTVCDVEPRHAVRERFSRSARIVVEKPDQIVRELDRRVRSAAVVMSHHYERDREALATLLRSRARYIGVLGPRRRTDRMLAEIELAGRRTVSDLQRLHAPVGLDIGAEGPEEIALSIVAEVQAALAGSDARRLRTRFGSIHAGAAAEVRSPEVFRSTNAFDTR